MLSTIIGVSLALLAYNILWIISLFVMQALIPVKAGFLDSREKRLVAEAKAKYSSTQMPALRRLGLDLPSLPRTERPASEGPRHCCLPEM